MAEIPAEHVGGVTAFAVTVTGVATELPFAGAVIVTMPLEVELKAYEASNNIHTNVSNFTGHCSRRSALTLLDLFSKIRI